MNSIINISEAVSIAFHSMTYIAQQEGKPIKIKQIAEYLDSSEAHIAKILQILSKKGYLKSNRGRNGGFVIEKPANEINFSSIYECFEPEICIEHCPFNKKVCQFSKCIYGDFFNDLKARTKKYFSNRYLSDVLEELREN
ncbi:MAG: Rrf2 family transcriptional regulator [Candidatus Cloacimonetes bacterium]|nr:Rrf2 family transcriptional regulator [Candidatus Cloacimonadota bacterium]